MLTGLVEHGEPEIGGLERGVLGGAGEEEVLRLEVAVHDAERVAPFDDPDDGPDEQRGGALGVVALGDDAVEELAAGAELHDDVDEQRVLVGAPDADDVWVLGEVVHDLDLAPHVLVVLPAQQLPLGDGLARVLAAVGLPHAQVRGPELPLPQLLPDAVVVPHVRRLVGEHRRRPPHRRRGHRRREPRARPRRLLPPPPMRLRVRLHFPIKNFEPFLSLSLSLSLYLSLSLSLASYRDLD
ncbi:Os12g0169950 [Oryza sativa Japonica Group]|uniref:Os12g0169950 protein n=1 Tax=Oryza sativa subsp. japonica TaxID=39947 RepID=A0A0P0Y7J8_ORYSJ|nr:Os12g0169950 [Oryza sativa Japonica Group]